ncbi:hypothetical protein F4821DRAFT_274448 [Hypoxylon rubiginosum]|uniref:Uncharacterized protein n=1 Tax=Hypoxylon rubiginosum TaxID=110542 RepID=A0ACC0CNV8_9PEZI|nr:hypothetical protein F4821DRAFT_274448 [Hypoxylon rubiginosum]
MSFSFRSRRPPLRHSKRLPREIEDQLRVLVFDAEDGPYDPAVPQLIIGNPESLCNGLCYISDKGPYGSKFVFRHAASEGKYTTECGCIKKYEVDGRSTDIPIKLQIHRLHLMFRHPYRLEPKYAAMVVMKLFLNMPVPEQLQIKPEEWDEAEKKEAEKKEAKKKAEEKKEEEERTSESPE